MIIFLSFISFALNGYFVYADFCKPWAIANLILSGLMVLSCFAAVVEQTLNREERTNHELMQATKGFLFIIFILSLLAIMITRLATL